MKAKVVFYVTGEDDDGNHFKHDWQQIALAISPEETSRAVDPVGYRQEIFDAAWTLDCSAFGEREWI